MGPVRAKFLTSALLLVALLLLGGCGGGSNDSSGGGDVTSAPAEVSEKQIAKVRAGTPQRTVLEWWRDVQHNDPEHARNLYATPPPLPDLAGQFNFVAGWLDGSVEIVAAKRKGEQTVVTARWVADRGEPRQVTLRLAEDGGEWKLLHARFLDAMVAERQSAEAG
jgi:hypothetical protein